jgi:hypothetical protein
LEWGPQNPIVLETISLTSPPDVWPPRIRLDYRIGDRHGCWEEIWDGVVLRDSSTEAAASLWLAVVHVGVSERHASNSTSNSR